MFTDFLAQQLNLRNNPIGTVGTGAFKNLTLDNLILSLVTGKVEFIQNIGLKDSNISNIYFPFHYVDYYVIKSAKCFMGAPQLCSKSIHIPLCTDILELIDCGKPIDELGIFFGLC